MTDVGSMQRIFADLGEPTQAPRVAPTARGPPLRGGLGARKGTDLSERARRAGEAWRAKDATTGYRWPIQGWMLYALPEIEFDGRVSG